MEQKQSGKGRRKVLVVGVSVVVVLLVLMGVGLAVRQSRRAATPEVFPGVSEVEEAADAYRAGSPAGQEDKLQCRRSRRPHRERRKG